MLIEEGAKTTRGAPAHKPVLSPGRWHLVQHPCDQLVANAAIRETHQLVGGQLQAGVGHMALPQD